MPDVLESLGAIFLGSRLKRLAEDLQVNAAKILADAGMPAVQPSHMPLLAALDRSAMTIGQLAEAIGASQPGVTRGIGQLATLGLVEVATGTDQRRRDVSLTPAGIAAMARAKLHVWPRVQIAVAELCGGDPDSFLARIGGIEAALAERSMAERAAAAQPKLLTVRPFSDALAPAFRDINTEWISSMFRLEQTDREVLDNPRERIVDPGGEILFVEAEGLGIVGTCALQKTGPTSFELTKMGVRESARGLKAGEFLLAAMIERARERGADPLYLLTSAKCEAAIHLYEKLGFRHDAGIMASYGARYARCDVAMLYEGVGG